MERNEERLGNRRYIDVLDLVREVLDGIEFEMEKPEVKVRFTGRRICQKKQEAKTKQLRD